MPSSPDVLLARLEALRSCFGPAAAKEVKSLLDQLSRSEISQPQLLLSFHEALLFLRAFPQSVKLIPAIEGLLNTFHLRIEYAQKLGADMSMFDDFDTSGIAGTTMQDTLSFEVVQRIVDQIPRNIEIAWDDYVDEDPQAERSMGATLRRFILLLAEDADVEANIPWRKWLDAARGRERDIGWLIRRFKQLPMRDQERTELYDSLRIPVRWRLENLKLSRTRNWSRPRKWFVHRDPLLTRSQVSLRHELAQPAPHLKKLSHKEGERVMPLIREIMLVRYRELYGTTIGDPRSVVRADVGRGVTIHLWNLPPERRLPLRAYVAGFTLKNGVPINYIEAIGLCEWIEVGFNTFYTYRQGETAWIYAQALRCLCAFTGATTISIYPYQIGQNNDEALDSGAFWFYRKLGFHSGNPQLEEVARREERNISANPKHRTSRKILKRLAEAHVFFEFEKLSFGRGVIPTRAVPLPSVKADLSTEGSPGAWDTFSTRNLALRANRRMASEFNGDADRIRQASFGRVTKALEVSPSRWSPAERRCLEDWSVILALITELPRWSRTEKRKMIDIIRAQAAANEMRYLHLTQQHPRLRDALLRLGSVPAWKG